MLPNDRKTESVVSYDGITVSQTVEDEQFGVPTVGLELASGREEPVDVRVVVELPPELSIGEVGFHPEYRREDWRVVEDRLLFETEVPAGDQVTTMYAVDSLEAEQRAMLLENLYIERVSADEDPAARDTDVGLIDVDEADAGEELVETDSVDTEESPVLVTAGGDDGETPVETADSGDDTEPTGSTDDTDEDTTDGPPAADESDGTPTEDRVGDRSGDPLTDTPDSGDPLTDTETSDDPLTDTRESGDPLTDTEDSDDPLTDTEDFDDSQSTAGESDDPQSTAGESDEVSPDPDAGTAGDTPAEPSGTDDLSGYAVGELLAELTSRIEAGEVPDESGEQLGTVTREREPDSDVPEELRVGHLQQRVSDVEAFLEPLQGADGDRTNPAELFDETAEQLETLAEQVEAIDETIEARGELLADLEQRLDGLEDETSELRQTVDGRAADVEPRLESVESDVESIEDRHERLESEVSTLNEWQERFKSALNSLGE